MELHSERKSCRATIQLRAPGGELVTLIALRSGRGQAARVWLTFDGAMKTTVTMDDPEVNEVAGMSKATHGAK